MKLWPEEFEPLREEARSVVQSGLASIEALLGPPPETEDPVQRAQLLRASFAKLIVPVEQARDQELAGVRCRVIRPEADCEGVYLHFHGGGMAIGTPELNDVLNLELCRRHSLAVVSVDYRLAPEHPWPAGPDDGTAVAAWLVEHAAEEFGSDRLILGGESAGGYMAAVVLLRMRDELGAIDRAVGANLVFGVYDWGRSPSQRGIRPQEGADMLSPEEIRFFADCYLPGRSEDERRDPGISPAFADLRGMPPALMSVGGSDHLLDDTLMLAVRWAAAGNDVELFVAPDLPHGFLYFPCELTRRHAKETDRWFSRIVEGSAVGSN